MKIKWYGTASILLEQNGKRLLFDPFISLNKKCFIPSMDEFSSAEHIFITHGHVDHIVVIPDIVERGNGNATVYCTAAPWNTLITKGVAEEQIKMIAPGDVLFIGPFEVRVIKGKHVVTDKRLVIQTLVNPRILRHWRNAVYLARENRLCAEAGETAVFDISVSGKRVLLMGSLNLDPDTDYPKHADLLIMPFQGCSNIDTYAMQFIDGLQPKKVMLTHFDDTFPPISRSVKTEGFVMAMGRKHPNIPVICPVAGNGWIDLD